MSAARGDTRARDPLVAALGDPSPLMQGSAAEALGLIGDATAADAIGSLVTKVVQSGALAQPPDASDDTRRDTPTAACRLALRRRPDNRRMRWIVRSENGKNLCQPLVPAAFFACGAPTAPHLG